MATSTGGENPETKNGGFKSFGVVVGQYNPEFSKALAESVRKELFNLEPETAVEFFSVPGAFEIPLVIKLLAQTNRYKALIALGVIIRGETAHGDLIGTAITEALLRIALEFSIPVVHEVLLVNDEEQARQRVGGEGQYDRGVEAARVAVEMANLTKNLRK
jgi:6,7-dimethyl-8-ribityllumazine synthase